MLFYHKNDSVIYTLEELNAKKASFAGPSTVYLGVLGVIGLIGNALVLYVYGKKFKSSTHNSFILALSTFDFLNCAVGIPTEIVDDQLPLMFEWEDACKILRLISFFSSGGSCFTLVIIALDRFQRVCLGREQIEKTTAKFVIVIATLIAAGAVSPIYELAGIDTQSTDVPYLKTSDCAIQDKYKKTKWPIIYFTYLSGIIAVSVIIQIFTYTMVGIAVNKRLGEKDLAGKTVVKTMGDMEREQERKMKSEKTTKTFFLVTTLFIMSYIPCVTIQVLRALTGFEPHSPRTEMIVNIGLRSYFLSNALNPFIYAYCNNDFRENCVTVFVAIRVALWEEPQTKANPYSMSDDPMSYPPPSIVINGPY